MQNALSVFVVGSVTALSLAAAPAAQAAGETVTGGCYDKTFIDPILTNGYYEGVLGDSSATQDSTGPVYATVTCYIQVNGVRNPSADGTYSGNGAQSGSKQIAYVAAPGDVAELCQRVQFASGFDTGVTCKPA
jgi:hypothetical protein